MPISSTAPAQAIHGSAVAYGAYRQPIPDPNVDMGGLLRRFRRKEWHYVSVCSDRWFVACAVVQLGYLGNAFGYAVDRENPEATREYEALSPLGRAVQFAPSSIRGETTWQRGRTRISMNARTGGWDVRLDIPLGRERLSGLIQLEAAGESLAVLFPVGGQLPAYSHKAVAMPAHGNLWLGAQRIALDNALASIDWTRAFFHPTTRWKWSAFAGRDEKGRRMGLNLSADLYENEPGDAPENAFWLDGRVYALGPVAFHIPDQPDREEWRIHSRDGQEVDLRFQPLGVRQQHVDLKLIKSDFIQPYGTYQGRIAPAGIEPVTVDGAFGVVERHFARW